MISVETARPARPVFAMLVKSSLAGGLILFAWQFISWSVLPLRNNVLQNFRDERAVTSMVVENAPESGIYLLPLGRAPGAPNAAEIHAAAQQQMQSGPMVFASVRLGPMKPMWLFLSLQLLTQILSALLGSLLLLAMNVATYRRRLLVLLNVALLIGVAGHLPNWNWFSFSAAYTALEMSDLLIGWSLAGLLIARIIR